METADLTRLISPSWLVTATVLVLLMQVGFALLEAGRVGANKVFSVARRNISTLAVMGCIFFSFSFPVIFGQGTTGFFGFGGLAQGTGVATSIQYAAYQFGLCAVTVSIISGVVAERMNYRGHLVMAAIISILIYPFAGHWAWGNQILIGNPAYLADMRFIDFAGATIVFGVGAWAGLAAAIVMGPRPERFDAVGNPKEIVHNSKALSIIGAGILFIGWTGFTSGAATSTLQFAAIIQNTVVGGCIGTITGLTLGYLIDGRRLRSVNAIKGMLGALVAVSAGCAFVSLSGAVALAVLGASAALVGAYHLPRVFGIDDALDGISVYGVAGIVGTIMFPFFTDPRLLPKGSAFEQAGVQVIGALIVAVFAFLIAFVALKIIDRVIKLRAQPEQICTEPVISEPSLNAPAINEPSQNENVEAQASAEQDKSWLANFTMLGADYLWETDANLKFTFVSVKNDPHIFQQSLTGVHLFKAVKPIDKTFAVLKNAINEQASFVDVAVQTKSKTIGIRFLRLSAAPMMGAQGEFIGYRGVSLDITESRKREMKLEKLVQDLKAAKEKAATISREKSEFLTTINDALRTPVNGILEVTEMLAQTELTPRQIDLADKVLRSSRSLLAVINDIPGVPEPGTETVKPKAELMAELHERRVLIVCDTENIQRSLVKQAMQLGLLPKAVGTARDALLELELMRVQHTPYELLITEYSMPEFNGVALANTLNRSSDYAHLHVVLVSSPDEKEHLYKANKNLFAHWLTEPMLPKSVARAVDKVSFPAREAAQKTVRQSRAVLELQQSLAIKTASSRSSGECDTLAAKSNTPQKRVG